MQRSCDRLIKTILVACLVALASSSTVPDLADASVAAPTAADAVLSSGAVAEKVSAFGFKLLSALQTSIPKNQSVFISPLSVATALGMVAMGATHGGEAEKELLGALGGNASEARGFLAALGRLSVVPRGREVGAELLTPNSVWVNQVIKKSYVEAVKKRFAATARPLPGSAEPINRWVSERTKGMIPSILKRIDPRTVAVLVNAVYFKGTWATKFNKSHTTLGEFKSAQGTARLCAMMQRTEKMSFFEWNGVQAVELPYGAKDGRYAAVLLFPPDAPGALSALTQKLGSAVGYHLAQLRPRKVNLTLPRFKVDFGVHDLKKVLQASFGVSQAFDGIGQFMEMSDDRSVKLSAVLHKAVLEVNEEGTTAAAATAAVMTRSAYDPTVQMHVDRPFIFLIRDRSLDLLLFAGVIVDPTFNTSGV